MPHRHKVFKLAGKVQHYAWGGYEYIPALLNITNPDHQPFAEYWMGAHTLAPSQVIIPGKEPLPLSNLINENPIAALGEEVYRKFGELPYLYKILDVREMLSIQVHPTRAEAIKGYNAENAMNIAPDAPNRNYKDKNHKPEVMLALSEFWLLHGFKPKELLLESLHKIPEFESFIPLFEQEGYKGLYRHVMEMPAAQADELLLPLLKREMVMKKEGELTRKDAGWWVDKLYNGMLPASGIDKGIFSIYFFNIVKLKTGEAIFQSAGVPHAYLEGQNVELMANSDNVLRGGLTPKHIDVPELMKHTLFEGIVPEILNGEVLQFGEVNYPCKTEDFCLSKIMLSPTGRVQCKSRSLEILILLEGNVRVHGSTNEIDLKKGEAFVALANERYAITASGGKAVLYKAYVPLD
jgi:mannose-6-phosphate isomerase